MKRRTRWLVLLAVLPLVAVAAGLALSERSAPSGSSPVPPHRLRYRWSLGTRLRYELDCRGESQSDLRKVTGFLGRARRRFTPTSSTARIQGILEMTPVEVGPRRVRLAVRLRDARVRVGVGTRTATRAPEELHADLAQEAMAVIERSGRVLSLAPVPGVSRAAAGVLRSVLGLIQLSLPATETSASWSAREVDAHGPYLAGYLVEGSSETETGPLAIRKRKIAYQRRPARVEGSRRVERYRPRGEMVARFDRRAGRLTSVEGLETLLTELAGRTVGTTRTRVSLRLVAAEPIGADELARLHAVPLSRPAALDAAQDDPAIDAAMNRAQLGGATVTDLLRRLAEATDATPQRERARLALSLEALAALRPQECRRLGRALSTLPPRSWKTGVLGFALARAGRPRAEAALLGVVRRHLGGAALTSLVPLLGAVHKPSVAVDALLMRIARGRSPAASMAALAVGSVARRVLATRPRRARHLALWAADHLARARTAAEKRAWLLVLGNAGGAAPRARVVPLTTDSAPSVRAAALWALRWQAGDAVARLLSRAARSDADPTARRAARRALAARARAGMALTAPGFRDAPQAGHAG